MLIELEKWKPLYFVLNVLHEVRASENSELEFSVLVLLFTHCFVCVWKIHHRARMDNRPLAGCECGTVEERGATLVINNFRVRKRVTKNIRRSETETV